MLLDEDDDGDDDADDADDDDSAQEPHVLSCPHIG